jgi:hypothetical protein
MPGSKDIKLFISYSHDDIEYFNSLKEYVNEGICSDLKIWDDKEIPTGSKWDNEIKTRLNDADIIILLVSISFLNSAYINDVELKNAFDKFEKDQCVIIPIFARTCPLDKPIAKKISSIQGYPRNDGTKRNFLNEMGKDIDNHLTEIYNGILETIDTIKRRREDEARKKVSTAYKEQSDAITNLKENFGIFLSVPCAEAGFKMRRDLFYSAKGKSDYEQWPFKLLPDITQINSVAQVDQLSQDDLMQELNASIYSIHIISSPDELNNQLVKDQLECAKQKNEKDNFSRSIIWLRSEDMMKNIDQSLLVNPVVAGIDFEKIYEIIDSFEAERKKKTTELENSSFSTGFKTMMIFDVYKDRDNQFRKKIKSEIEKRKKYTVRLNKPDATVEELKDDISKCDGALIVYGDCEAPWYLYRQDLFFEAQTLRSKAVCVSNPKIDDKIESDISVGEFIVIREDSDFQTGLNDFLNNLEK